MPNRRIDILNRKKFVEDVFNIIETLSENKKSCTFAINGKWGSGKSFVLEMLEEKLSSSSNGENNDQKYTVFHYSCWEYDYYDEPLIAIVSAMYDMSQKHLGLFSEKNIDKLKTVLIIIKNILGYSLSGFFNKIYGINSAEIVEKTATEIDDLGSKDYDENSSFKEALKITRETVSKISQENTVVVIVDELDRCLPEYAIKVLERLHHIFDDIENLVVLLAVDKNHLNNTVSKIFNLGKNDDVDYYLSKFISFEVDLDNGIVDENYKLKYEEYLSKFTQNDCKEFSVDDYVSTLLNNFDARKRNRIFEKALLVHNLIFNEPVDISIMCAELLWIVYAIISAKEAIIKEDIIPTNGNLLPNIFSNRLPKFDEFFKKSIFYNANISSITGGGLRKSKAYYISHSTFGKKELVLYFISKKSNLDYEILFDKPNHQYKNLENQFTKFVELLDLIK